MLLKGKPVLYYSLRAFEEYEAVHDIILVTAGEDIEYCRNIIVNPYGFTKVRQIVAGGKERYDSVYQGLLAAEDSEYVLIHDGARPCIDKSLLERCMDGVRKYDACVAAMPVKETIKTADNDQFVEGTPNRNRLWSVQTPQVFSYTLIRRAYEEMYRSQLQNVTDDAMVVEAALKHRVKLVEGLYRNIKITTPEDLDIAELFL